jgi:hypothetical protein
MRTIVLVAALSLTALATEASGESPFATPREAQPGQPDIANLISLGDIMGDTQLRHIKLWYAGKSEDWDLAAYELNRISESPRRAGMLYVNIPVELIESAGNPLVRMREAVSSMNLQDFVRSYTVLTAACNACHQVGGVGFIQIQTPTSSPFTDEVFGK